MTAPLAIRRTRDVAGYQGYWRFSELRSAPSAMPGRSEMNGIRTTRCMTATRR